MEIVRTEHPTVVHQKPIGNTILVPKELKAVYEFTNPTISQKRTYDDYGRVKSEERIIKADRMTVYPLGDSQGKRLELPQFGIDP